MQLTLFDAPTAPPPVIIWWENVPGVLSDDGNAFGCLLAALVGGDEPLVHPDGTWPSAGVVLGPDRELAWRSFDAQYFKLAQRRERVFVVASSGEISPVEILFESEGVQRHSPPCRGEGEDVAPTLAGGARKSGGFSEDDIPHVAVFGGNNTGGAIDVSPALNAKGGSGRMDFESEALVVHGTQDPIVSHIAHTLGRNTGQEKAVCVDITNQRLGGDLAGTLEAAQDRGNRGQGVMSDDRVRRLTPTEGERLQGLPDGHTAIPWRGKPASECPDGPRYKATGNSMAMHVMQWIGRRIDRARAIA